MNGNGLAAQRDLGTYALAGSLGLVVIHRLFLALSTGFVIGDGGLFDVFVKSIAQTFPSLPASVSYNGLSIPFAYPPLAFWIGASLVKIGIEPLGIVHFMPIAMNAIYFVLFALLLARSGMSRISQAIGVLSLFANERSIDWLVMGGGLSRGMGSIFFVLTLLAMGTPEEGRCRLSARRLALAGLCVGATILAHLEWGIDSATAVVVVAAFRCTTPLEFMRSVCIAGFVALLTIAPWLLAVYSAHGMEPFLSASQASQIRLSTYVGNAKELFNTSGKNPFVLIGLFFSLKEKRFFWIALLLSILLATPRHGLTPAALPLAALAAFGVLRISPWLANKLGWKKAWAFIVPIIFIGTINPNYLAMGVIVRPLGDDQLASMNWVRKHHSGDQFLVLSSPTWPRDAAAEWFPVLAGTRSVNTVQGREWLSDGSFSTWDVADWNLKQSETCDELLNGIKAFQTTRYIWTDWEAVCFPAREFRSIYRNESVTIFERL